MFLDTGVLGMVSNPKGKPRNAQCRQWARDLVAAGVWVFVPEICDYEETPGKLIHNGEKDVGPDPPRPAQGLVGLRAHHDGRDAPGGRALGRRGAGGCRQPVLGPLDADAILAAQVIMAADPGDIVTIASDNVGHLAQFVDAAALGDDRPVTLPRLRLPSRSRSARC